MSDELVPVDKQALSELIKAKNTQALVEALSQEIEKPKKVTSAAARRKEMRKLQGTKEFQEQLRSGMADYVSLHVSGENTDDLPVRMSQEEIDRLAEEYEDYEQIINFLKMRQELMKERVFAHLDDEFTEQAKKRVLERPIEKMNGSVIASNGVVFKRERGSRKDPKVNWEKLRSSVPAEAYEAVCEVEEVPEVHIPASRRLNPSEEKLMAALESGTITLKQVQDALIPGDWNSTAFVVRRKDSSDE